MRAIKYVLGLLVALDMMIKLTLVSVTALTLVEILAAPACLPRQLLSVLLLVISLVH